VTAEGKPKSTFILTLIDSFPRGIVILSDFASGVIQLLNWSQ